MCTSIASTFYADRGVMELAITNAGIDINAEYAANDINLLKCALELVQGFVNTLQIEGDVHNNTNWDAVKANIIRISNKYGLDPSEYITLSSVEDASVKW
jgi:hypothetical protein